MLNLSSYLQARQAKPTATSNIVKNDAPEKFSTPTKNPILQRFLNDGESVNSEQGFVDAPSSPAPKQHFTYKDFSQGVGSNNQFEDTAEAMTGVKSASNDEIKEKSTGYHMYSPSGVVPTYEIPAHEVIKPHPSEVYPGFF